LVQDTIFQGSIQSKQMSNILITGASRGIGRETTLAFARAGHHVFAAMRDPSRSPDLIEIAKAENLDIESVAMDVDSDNSVCKAVQEILAKVPIDTLINNAGIQLSGSVEELPLHQVRRIMETNFFGALRCIQALLPTMRMRRSGCIVNVSSGSGRYSHPPFAAYSASKWALEAMSEALAAEMKTFDVRVIIVEPVLIDTAMSREIATKIPSSVYMQPRRFASFYAAGLNNPVPAALVAAKIFAVSTSGTWKLRHPVGPAAVPIMRYRERMSDEDWISVNAAPDEIWEESVRRLNESINEESHENSTNEIPV
jgi:NAD(P)-dependent dehydrogenase (short-subunit alcohol dehydrogenase family)